MLDSLGLCPCPNPISSFVFNSVDGAILTIGQFGALVAAGGLGILGEAGAGINWASGGDGGPPPGVNSPVDAGAEAVDSSTGTEGAGNYAALLAGSSDFMLEQSENLFNVAKDEGALTWQLENNNADILVNCL